MIMAEIILYITDSDARKIVSWLNAETSIAWIVKDSQRGRRYRWRAVNVLGEFSEGAYCLWKTDSGPLRIPSGAIEIEDKYVSDPFAGWSQDLNENAAQVPWFGAAAPETFEFVFRETGRSAENSIGRSGFHWIGNHFSAIGEGAPKESEKWWARLRRYIKKSSTGVSWPEPLGVGKTGAYAFPEAYEQLEAGRARDLNP